MELPEYEKKDQQDEVNKSASSKEVGKKETPVSGKADNKESAEDEAKESPMDDIEEMKKNGWKPDAEESEKEDESKEDIKSPTDEAIDEFADLSKILSDKDDKINDAIKKLEQSPAANTPEVEKLLSMIKEKDQVITNMQKQMINIITEKTDLKFKNAELEAFGWIHDPQLLVIVKNLEKAKSWDKPSQEKIKNMISDIYSNLFWGDIGKEHADKVIGDIAEISTYNSKRNPNIDSNKKQESGISM